jgi:hypothetical protein
VDLRVVAPTDETMKLDDRSTICGGVSVTSPVTGCTDLRPKVVVGDKRRTSVGQECGKRRGRHVIHSFLSSVSRPFHHHPAFSFTVNGSKNLRFNFTHTPRPAT